MIIKINKISVSREYATCGSFTMTEVFEVKQSIQPLNQQKRHSKKGE